MLIIKKKSIKRKKEITFTIKKKRKRTMISEFITLLRRLCISDSMPDYQLFQDKNVRHLDKN